MSVSPLICYRLRHGQPAPLPIDDLSEDFFAGAVRVDLSAKPWSVEWSNGLAEFSYLTDGCCANEAFGLYISRFSCMTAIDRLFKVSKHFGMAMIWDDFILFDDEMVTHYNDDIKRFYEDFTLAETFEELVSLMSIRWINCPLEASLVM